ncbi:MAG: hypothetical protein GQ564_21375 [Bacteroidales bacterium]|nr:hypothetical protein [Bacteroidales bacterium]
MKKTLLVIIIICPLIIITWPLIISAQKTQLYETINYQHAVKNGTRSRDGKPGSKYWQNHADYDISVKLDPAKSKIFGKETIIYYNESPDTLKAIVIRLYPNRNKKGAVSDWYVDVKDMHDGVKLDTIMIKNSGILNNITDIVYNGTNVLFLLEKTIPPNSNIELYCEWNYRLAMEPYFRRTDYYKDEAWFIGYFYPQIAVYDDLENSNSMKGWDYKLFHTGIQEFYNDFNNYKVKIDVPEDFFVWATGELTNPDEVYSKPVLDKIEKAKTANEIVKIVSKEDLNKKLLIGNSWEFEAKNVTDFAFGTALNYLWDGTSVQLNDKRVFVDVAYNPTSELYPKAIDIARRTVLYASNNFPQVQFPYSHATTFNGMLRGGMEFPMIANNSDTNDSIKLYDVVAHELFHNYLPFMMGINEKRYGFMDEGFAIVFNYKFLCNYFKNNTTYKFYGFSNGYSLFDIYEYYFDRIEDNTSIYKAFEHIKTNNSFFHTYIKPAVALNLFIDMVGEDKFIIAFKEFVARWEGKHPTPYDYFYTMNDVLNENYNWYWQSWYFEIGNADLGIELKDNIVSIQNVGGYPLPIELIVEYKDGISKSISKSMNVWKNGEKNIKINIENFKQVKSVQINSELIPDINNSNNYVSI